MDLPTNKITYDIVIVGRALDKISRVAGSIRQLGSLGVVFFATDPHLNLTLILLLMRYFKFFPFILA